MGTTGRIDVERRKRIACWTLRYLDLKASEGVNLTLEELEHRLHLGKGYGTRILRGERIGLDTFAEIVKLIAGTVRAGADTILFEDPRPNAADGAWRSQKPGRPMGSSEG